MSIGCGGTDQLFRCGLVHSEVMDGALIRNNTSNQHAMTENVSKLEENITADSSS